MNPAKSEFPGKAEELPRVLPLKWILHLIQKETRSSFQISQLLLLLTIMDQDGIPYPDIMTHTGLPASTISRNVKDLSKQGLVEIIVDPDDTRCHAAKLTKKGGDLKRGIQEILSGNFIGPPRMTV
jgi:DNA-binding MarR family transcriptional regulator